MVLPLFYALLGTGAATILNDIAQQLRISNCRNQDLKILIPLNKIEELKGNYKPIICEGRVGTIRSELHVACGHWDILKGKFTDKEKREGRFNLLDYLSELALPPSIKKSPEKNGNIGLVTYQNGINNTPDDFKNKGTWILENLPERPLCIGLFNPSNGKFLPGPTGAIPDLYRMREEKVYNTDTLATTWCMFRTFAKFLPKDPNFFWLHIAHSEGTILANSALSNALTPIEEQDFFRRHLHILTYGAVMPVPLRITKGALNTYSSEDITLKVYGKSLQNNPNYKIEVVNSRVSSPPFPEGDHDFLGDTYKSELKKNFKQIRVNYDFCKK